VAAVAAVAAAAAAHAAGKGAGLRRRSISQQPIK